MNTFVIRNAVDQSIAMAVRGHASFMSCRAATSLPSMPTPAAATTVSLFPQRRDLSTTKTSTTSRDSRVAGRPRFYQKVDVTPLEAAPWKHIGSVMGSDNTRQYRQKGQQSTGTISESTVIASPISAGVDGTQSATGIRHIPGNSIDAATAANNLEWMLTPRLPGDTTTSTSTAAATSALDSSISWYGVTLDGKTLSTPMGQKLAVPSQTLAYMIAAEWDAQTKHLQPANMPLMTLACTTLDQVAFHPNVYRDEALKFLPTDTTCFWADPTEDRVLNRRQADAWTGIHDYCHQRLGAKPTTAMGLEGILMSRRRGSAKPFAGLPHSMELMEAARTWTESLDAWQLSALSSINSQAKSFLVGFAMLDIQKGHHQQNKDTTVSGSAAIGVEKAIEASRVEEEFQISNWGLVEGGHDYDRLNCSIQLHAASLFAKTILLDTTSTIQTNSQN